MKGETVMQHTSTRIPAIDVAKGIGIVCIVSGHVIPNFFVYSLLYAFHVPLFFVLSGLTYHFKADKRLFWLDKIRRILVPYAVFSLLSIVVYRLGAPLLHTPAEQTRLLPNLLGMLYANTNTGWMAWNRPLWFLPCLFAVLMLVDLFETQLRRMGLRHTQFLRCCFIAASLALGALLNTIPGLNLPFQLESAVLLAAFGELGVMLQQANKQYDLIKKVSAFPAGRLSICMLLLALVSLGVSRFNGHIDVRAHILGKSTLLMFMAACGFIAVILALSVRLQSCRWLRQAGVSSLSILLMHKFPILLFQVLLPFTGRLLSAWDTLPGFLCGILVAGATLWLCLLAEKVLTALCPAVLGKRKTLS